MSLMAGGDSALKCIAASKMQAKEATDIGQLQYTERRATGIAEKRNTVGLRQIAAGMI